MFSRSGFLLVCVVVNKKNDKMTKTVWATIMNCTNFRSVREESYEGMKVKIIRMKEPTLAIQCRPLIATFRSKLFRDETSSRNLRRAV